MDRYSAVTRVLLRVLVLNLAVATAKIALGLATGAISVLSDGFHSLTDTAANVVALVGVRLARRPPDEDHPYGHRKFETMASVGILVFLVLVLVQVLWAASERLASGGTPHVTPVSFAVMGSTFLVNLGVVAYERRASRRLSSEILLADAHHTQSDLLTSAAVTVALVGVSLGYAWLDTIAALVIAGFIGYACWEIFQDTARILSDRIVLDEIEIEREVCAVPRVIGCHHIRTRGSVDHVFLDLHIWLNAEMRLHDAHDVSHVVKDRLMARFPQIKDAVIHIEPPPR
ncbi:MAG: cation diffusion facilitator family transporter [Acidobacteria bacterium]|nr:cation diffusion facilitator family transporter [Acidobacteriota bacterium]